MSIKFTEIPDKLPYKNFKFIAYKSKISTMHSDIVSYVVDGHFSGTFREKNSIIRLMNSVTYRCIQNEFLDNWNSKNPMIISESIYVDDIECKQLLQDSYISEKDVIWDVDISDKLENVSTTEQKVDLTAPIFSNSDSFNVTDKSDLYIQPPTVPRFDINSVYVSKVISGDLYTIYKSLPVIPTKQNEISVTTDLSQLTSYDLLKLYPTQFIPTRAKSMYSQYSGLEYDDLLGVIIPIEGFTSDQVRSNIIEYPHLYKLTKCVDSQISSFYTTIELDGKLHSVIDVCKELPDFQKMPCTSDFIKEYVVRRYLLERDILKINHKYKMHGELNPFLTLFMTPEQYRLYGYTDFVQLARKCVESRIIYKQSRNPILRRINNA